MKQIAISLITDFAHALFWYALISAVVLFLSGSEPNYIYMSF